MRSECFHSSYPILKSKVSGNASYQIIISVYGRNRKFRGLLAARVTKVMITLFYLNGRKLICDELLMVMVYRTCESVL